MMGTRGCGGEWSDRKQGNQPGQASGIVPTDTSRVSTGDRAVLASLHYIPSTGFLFIGGLQPFLLTLPGPGHAKLHLPA